MSGAPGIGRTAVRIAFAAFLIYVVSGGGRVVGSDEVSMLELSRGLLHGRVTVPEGATVTRPDGTHVTKNAAGQAVLALPLVALGEAVSGAAGHDPARRTLAVRFVASFFNAIVTSVLLGLFYAGARRLGVRRGAAFAATALLGFTTPVWVYAKSFMAEPLQALGLLAALTGASLAGRGDDGAPGPRGAPLLAGLGVLIAVSAKLSMLPLAIACLIPLAGAPPARWRLPALGLAVALAGHGVYDWARFGTPLETGYGAQATPAAYTTPLLVGLYGLLISSGKGVMWFAPALWLAPGGWRAMVGAGGAGAPLARAWARPRGRAAVGALVAAVGALLLYGTFQHWAGDGSFGPRYLVPVLPAAFLAVAFALDAAGRARRAVAVALGAIGLFVQIGGVAIYFGAQMREAGDYPYRMALDNPRFMSDSHFNPAFSPIAGHWRMLTHNLAAHLRGEMPNLRAAGPADARLGVSAEAQRELLGALDFWWLYLVYAGFPRAPVFAAALVLLALGVWAAARAWGACRSERAP